MSEPLTSEERGGNEYQKPLKPLRDLPNLQTEPSPTLWTVLNFLFRFDQMAENLNLLGVNKKRYFVEAIKGPTRSVIQALGIPTTEYEVLKKSVIMSTCGLDWVAEVEGQWRKLYQGSNSIELHLETVNIYRYGDDHWKWHVSGGPVLGANETKEFIIRSLGATRKGGVETGTTQEWHLLQGATGES